MREEIAVIGGGVGGVHMALMLARNPHYHVTLIEGQDRLLNGASMIAARWHSGGEYPFDRKTQQDCLTAAVIGKLLLPPHIFTPAPPMKFLVPQEAETYSQDHPDHPKALTVDKYLKIYEKIRSHYKGLFEQVQNSLGLNVQQTQDALLGSCEKGQFCRKLRPEEVSDYNHGNTKIAGGLQTQELGLNIPKYLAMLQLALEDEQRKGNITILTGHKVRKDGISGDLGQFRIACENGKTITASQVVQAAWQGGPEITPQLEKKGGKPKEVKVFKRAMLLVDLEPGWTLPPAFIMEGAHAEGKPGHGGMIAPFNDKIALCYLPMDGKAYGKECVLTSKNPSLPADWNEPMIDKDIKAKAYFEEAKKRFPALKNASNPRLVTRDTISFQPELHQRRLPPPAEVVAPLSPSLLAPSIGMGMDMSMEQHQEIELVPKDDRRTGVFETQRGRFTLYPTKGTYSLHAALQAEEMVNTRSANRNIALLTAKNDHTLQRILENKEKYSLAKMREPNELFYAKFFSEHPDLSPRMLAPSWAGREEGRDTIGR